MKKREGQNLEEKQAVCFIKELCRYAGEDDAFARRFWEKLSADEEIYREFLYYIANGNFACQAKVEGYTVVDVMVWQMDHFKARLDRDNSGTRQNGDRMLLLAIDTLLDMRRNPREYIAKMQGETGTDYPDKY